MWKRSVGSWALLLGIAVLVSGSWAPVTAAGAGPGVRVAVASEPAGSGERPVDGLPAHRAPLRPSDMRCRGVTVLGDSPALVLLVESVGVTGDVPTAADNDFTRIDSAIQVLPALGDGTEVRLVGTFDWNESFAHAAWVSADFFILAPTGLADVTVRAVNLGDATILGPGEGTDPAVFWEGFLAMYGGTYQGWTVENLTLRGFEWPLGMYGGEPGSSLVDFNGATVRNNIFDLPVDAHGPLPTDDESVFQNIGLHLGFGVDQTVEGNEFLIPGTGLSDHPAGLRTSTVALQSNTSGGAVYDGLLIAGNIVRITGAQSADPEQVYGIWENGGAHASNITVADNVFINEHPGNDPALNWQRAFRVTSHSSATSTVLYRNNVAMGANAGIRWLDDGYTFNPPPGLLPVQLVGNTLVGNGTAVDVHADGADPNSKANLVFNRIVGNVVGVRSNNAEVTAVHNWWGCNAGPDGGLCDGTLIGGGGAFDADPWLVLTAGIAPSVVPIGGSAVVNASLQTDSDGFNTAALGAVPDGTPAGFASAGGGLSPAVAGTVDGVAGSVFTAGMTAGLFTVDATVDSETVAVGVEIIADADVSVVVIPAVQMVSDGDAAAVTVTVANAGPAPAAATDVLVDMPPELTGVTWTCSGSGGGACSAFGTGDVVDVAGLPAGGSVEYLVSGVTPDPFLLPLDITAEAAVQAPAVDPDITNNLATGVVLPALPIFSDGFELGDTSAWSATQP